MVEKWPPSPIANLVAQLDLLVGTKFQFDLDPKLCGGKFGGLLPPPPFSCLVYHHN
jgi:hypothetical protein